MAEDDDEDEISELAHEAVYKHGCNAESIIADRADEFLKEGDAEAAFILRLVVFKIRDLQSSRK